LTARYMLTYLQVEPHAEYHIEYYLELHEECFDPPARPMHEIEGTGSSTRAFAEYKQTRNISKAVCFESRIELV